jgi:hypothetical protein
MRPLLWLALSCASLTFAAGIHLKLTLVDARENCTVGERMRRATERTRRRLASAGGVTAPVRRAEPHYVAEFLIGDPPQRTEAIVESGSNLVWTQCSACSPYCFDQTLPRYNMSASRTAALVPCNDSACALGKLQTQCTRDGRSCKVVTGYKGTRYITGVLATELFTFGSESATLAFGCVAVKRLQFPEYMRGASGYIGLGRGGLSLHSQLGASRFSYCFTPYFLDTVNASHLFVGPAARLVADAPVTSVPFVKSPSDYPYSLMYYLPLEGISVGGARLDVPAAALALREVEAGSWAGTFIHSDISHMVLVDVAYQALKTELARQLGASLVPPPVHRRYLDLCVAPEDLSGLVPPMVLHFGDAGDVEIPPENYWGPSSDVTAACMMVISSAQPNGTLARNGTTMIGNYMQQNMHLLYDLAEGVLSFQKADCSSM